MASVGLMSFFGWFVASTGPKFSGFGVLAMSTSTRRSIKLSLSSVRPVIDLTMSSVVCDHFTGAS